MLIGFGWVVFITSCIVYYISRVSAFLKIMRRESNKSVIMKIGGGYLIAAILLISLIYLTKSYFYTFAGLQVFEKWSSITLLWLCAHLSIFTAMMIIGVLIFNYKLFEIKTLKLFLYYMVLSILLSVIPLSGLPSFLIIAIVGGLSILPLMVYIIMKYGMSQVMSYMTSLRGLFSANLEELSESVSKEQLFK